MKLTLGQAGGAIAKVLASVDHELRGDVLSEAARQLRDNGQYYTARCVEAASIVYGTSDDVKEAMRGRTH